MLFIIRYGNSIIIILPNNHVGVDIFDSIWYKLYNAENTTQKENIKADLKKGNKSCRDTKIK